MKRKIGQREVRHKRIRKKVIGTKERPRLCVHRSLNNLTAQIIDDIENKTVLFISTFNKEIKPHIKYGGNVKAAEQLGKLVAEKAKSKGINTVVFDRGGYMYHGRVKAFAEAARKGGLIF